MPIKLRCLFWELSLWLLAEILLGYLEFDNLADYSEYLKEHDIILLYSIQG